jgi:Beta-lactamase superfamily domain
MSVEKFMSWKGDGVFFIGHSSALIRLNQKLILCDPVWGDYKPYGNYWKFFPNQVDCDIILNKVEACTVSHMHADHWCPDILEKLKCEVDVMEGRNELIRALALKSKVRVQPKFMWVEILPGVWSYWVPSPTNETDSCCFIRSEDFCVFHGNDCFLDEQTLSLVRRDVNRVDVALLGWQSINIYPWLCASLSEDEKLTEESRLNIENLNKANLFRQIMRPKHVVPFGGNLYYNSSLKHPLNRALTPAERFVENPLKPGGYILSSGFVESELRHEDFHYDELPSLDFHGEMSLKGIDFIEDKIKDAPPFNHTIVINDTIIDCWKAEAHKSEPLEPISGPSTFFFVNEHEYNKWRDGEMTFEQVIGSRRFQYHRLPNQYDPRVLNYCQRYL